MPNRHAQEPDYKYGFNGMEKLDELHDNSADSYDFGARIYDARLGRWLSTDALATSKPDISPYQAFRNCPLVFKDPDGKDEWNVVIVKDKGGKVVSKTSVRVSTINLMSGGVKEISDGGGGYYRMSNGYDFKNEMVFQQQDDGTVKHMSTEQVLLKQNGIKDREYGCFAKKKGTEYNCGISSTGFEMPGGMYIYGSGGMGTKYYTRTDVASMNSDDLLTMFGSMCQADFEKLGKGSDAMKDLINAVTGIVNELDSKKIKGKENTDVQSNQDKDSGKVNLLPDAAGKKDTIYDGKGGSETQPVGGDTTGNHANKIKGEKAFKARQKHY